MEANAERARKARERPRDENGDFSPRELSAEEKKLLKKGDARKLAKYHAPAAMKILATLMRDTTVRPDVRISAAKELLDRAEGKPRAATIDVEGPALRIVVGSGDKAKK